MALPLRRVRHLLPRPAGDSLPTPWQRGWGTRLSHFWGETDKKQQFKAQPDILSPLLSKI